MMRNDLAFAILRDAATAGAPTPSLRAIGRELGCSTKTARQVILELFWAGKISIHSGDKYRIYEIVATGARTVPVGLPEPPKPQDAVKPDKGAITGSRGLLKAVAKYHHSRGRPGWSHLL